MNIRAHFSQEPNNAARLAGAVRLALHITVDATPDETALLGQAQFLTTTPFPTKLFQFANKGLITTATAREMTLGDQTTRVPAFVKAMLPIQTWVANVALRVAVPGSTNYGFINPSEQATVTTWLNAELPRLATLITEIAEKALAETAASNLAPVVASAQFRTNQATAPATPAIRVTHKVVSKIGQLIRFS